MKTIKKIQVGVSPSGMHRMTREEMMVILGGTGCCWDTLEYLYNTIYDANVTASQFQQSFASFMQDMESEYGDSAHLNEDGDPTLAQSNYLLRYINQFFQSTTSWKNSGGSWNFGIMKGEDNDGHAVVIQGGKEFDWSTREFYYNVYDASKSYYKVNANQMLELAPVSGYEQ